MAARLEQDAKRRAEKKPDPVIEKTGLPNSDLVAILHALRTPLNAIVGYAELMHQETFGALGSPKYAGYCSEIKRTGRYLLGLISEVLDMSRLESVQFQIPKEIYATFRAAVTEQSLFAAEVEQDENRRAEEKPAPVGRTPLLRSGLSVKLNELSAAEVEQEANLSPNLPASAEARGVALWDEAIESLGRSAGVLEELAESTGEAIARITSRGDRIDRIQKDTRALLNALVASEADA